MAALTRVNLQLFKDFGNANSSTRGSHAPGMFSASAPMAGYPKIYNIEMDPHEDLVVGALFGWTAGPMLEVVEKYKETSTP